MMGSEHIIDGALTGYVGELCIRDERMRGIKNRFWIDNTIGETELVSEWTCMCVRMCVSGGSECVCVCKSWFLFC